MPGDQVQGVTLIRPDGSRLEGVAPGDVGVLKSLNYKEETPEEHFAEVNRQAVDAHWNTPGQKLLTGVEGLTSGASLGATDLLFGDAASQRRAEYHPGIRLGTELVGGFYAPVGALGRAAESLAESKTIRGALRGAVEGAQYGAGSAITNAQLSGDPQSVEAIAAGVGWGGIFGGGLGAVAGKVGEKVEVSAMAQRKAVEAAAKEESAVGAISEEKWGAVRGAVTDAKSTLEKAVTDAETQVGAVGDAEAKAPDQVYEHYSSRPEPPEVPPHTINSMAGGSGPNGVYAYQENAAQKTFATDRPYKFKLKATVPVTDSLKYTADDLAKDMAKLKASGVDTDLIHSKWEKYKDNFRGPRPFAEFWYTITKAGDHGGEPNWSFPGVHNAKTSTELLNKIDRTALADRAGVMYSSEPEQAAFFSNKSFKVIPDPQVESKAANEYLTSSKSYLNDLTNTGFVTSKNPTLREAASQAQKLLPKIKLAAKTGAFEELQTHLDAFEEHMAAAHEEVGKIDPSLAAKEAPPIRPETPILQGKAKKASEAMSELADMTSISTQLKSFPVTAEGIANLSKMQADKLGAALDHLGSLKSSELAGVKSAVQGSINDLMEHLALPIKGSPGTQFRGLWETLKGAEGSAATKTTKMAAEGVTPWHKLAKKAVGYTAGYAGEQVAAKLGATGFTKFVGYEAGKNMLFALMNLKGAVLGHVAGKVADWAPKGVNYVAKIAPRIEPLKTRLDGTIDNVNKSKADLIIERAKEIRSSAMSFSDTVYKGLQPLDKFHPDLAVGLHSLSVEQFKFLIDKLPQDPGHAFSALKTLWKPDEVATEKFSRYYEVLHDPTGVISKALTTHKITPEAAEGLREMWPELYTEFRGRMLEKIASIPLGKLGYNEQVHLGLMLSLPLHSTMTPQFISSHMQMFTERNQKLPMPPQTGAGGTKGGRPSGGSATAAQKVEQH